MDHQKTDALHEDLKLNEKTNNSNMLHCTSSICPFSLQNPSELQQISTSTRKLFGLITFYLLAMFVEIVGGLKSNSLSVLTDAAHMLSDVAGFTISLFAVWASSWKPTSQHSFGFYRLEVIGALFSVQLIWLVTGFLMFEAIDRMAHGSEPINGRVMFLVASFGFAINVVTLVWMGHHHHDCHPHHHYENSAKLVSTKVDTGHEKVQIYAALPFTDIEDICDYNHDKETAKMNINLEGAYLHVVSDLIQSVGVMVAGAVIWAKPNWVFVDLICTSVFSIAVLVSTKPMLANVLGILMERTPREIDSDSIENVLKCVKGVSEVHDLHVWSVTVGKTALCCHVKVESGFVCKKILQDIRHLCMSFYQINHVTVQIEQE